MRSEALRHELPEHQPVEVFVKWTGEAVRIIVRDHGVGFPPTMLAGEIEPFRPGARGKTAGPEGAGLGLAIVRAVAEAHGGSVALENPESGGALVTVVLRAPPEEPLPATLDSMAAGP